MSRKIRKTIRINPVLIVQHAEHEHPAILKRALATQGIPTVVIHPYLGDPFLSQDKISGIISLGGPMSVNDEKNHPWLKDECRLIRKCQKEGKPIVGICLGGQIIAKAMGGSVEVNPQVEIGWFPISVNSDGIQDIILSAAGHSPHVYHWHGETFRLPKQAKLLAQSQACERQAFKLGHRVYGFQFHPEADHQLISEWLSVEGVEQELIHARIIHGKQTVQDTKTQKNRARKGEKASLAITSAIGSLFRDEVWICKNKKCVYSTAELKAFAKSKKALSIRFLSELNTEVQLQGKIYGFIDILAGKFIILQDKNKILWPIRDTDILLIHIKSNILSAVIN